MKKYNDIKNSRIEWIESIPNEWRVLRLKYLVEGTLMYGANEAAEEDNPNNPRYIRITDFDSDGSLKEDTFKSLPPEKAKDYLLKEGDILFARSGATVGKTFQFKSYNGQACFAGYLIKASFVEQKISSDYIYYFTKSNYYENWKNSIFQQATIQNIGADKYSNLYISIPLGFCEQIKISQFLDFKTAQIDKLIIGKEKLIALLNEERIAIINKAVTKGLNPDLPMIDSGIDWLGKIPTHWNLKKLKYVAKINQSSLAENTPEDYELQYIDIGSVSSGGQINQLQNFKFKDAPSRARRIVKNGDIIVSTVRTYLKAIAQIRSNEENLIASTGFAVVHANKRLNSEFLFHLLKSEKIIDTICSVSRGVSYPSVTSSDILNLPIWYPQLDEQLDIINYLRSEEVRIESICAKLSKEIEHLREYKIALISEVVTGKVDVQNEVIEKSLTLA